MVHQTCSPGACSLCMGSSSSTRNGFLIFSLSSLCAWCTCCVSCACNYWLDCLLSSIGYPVVTLGFGFKSYVSYKMRLRKQKEVQKENEFYMQLLQQALPPEQQMLQKQEKEAEEGRSLLLSCGPNRLVRFCLS